MKNRPLTALAALLLASFLVHAGCAKQPAVTPEPGETSAPAATLPVPTENAPKEYSYTEESFFYPSRGIDVPGYAVVPETEAGEKPPLAVILHGHGGTNEGLAHIARALAKAGIASIRMDFSGCGSSTESFRENNLTNMKTDALAAIAYMEERFGTDPDSVALIGYSMGGRASLELVEEGSVSPYAMLLIAPAASTTDLIRLFGGESRWKKMKADAFEKGFGLYNTGYSDQELGPEFFRAIERISDPVPGAAARFTGRALVVWSSNDGVVLPEVSRSAADALKAETLVSGTEGHACGLYGPPEGGFLQQIIEKTVVVFTSAHS